MKKKTLIILIISAAVLLVVSFCQFWPKGTQEEPSKVQPTEDVASGFLPTQMEDPAKFEKINEMLNGMATCLSIKVSSLGAHDEFNFETLKNLIAQDLGDIDNTMDSGPDSQPLVHKVYYKNKSEFTLVEQSGQIFSVEVSHGGKAFSCTNIITAEFNCKCK